MAHSRPKQRAGTRPCVQTSTGAISRKPTAVPSTAGLGLSSGTSAAPSSGRNQRVLRNSAGTAEGVLAMGGCTKAAASEV